MKLSRGKNAFIHYLLASLLLLAVAISVGRYAVVKFSNQSSSGRYLLVSNRPEALDSSLKELPAEHYTYVRGSDPVAKGLMARAVAPGDRELVLIKDEGGHLSYQADTATITAKLDDLAHTNSGLPLMTIVIGAILGMLVGVFASNVTIRFSAAAIALSFVAVVVKFRLTCPTCQPMKIAGIDLTIAGLVVYGILTGAAFIFPNLYRKHYDSVIDVVGAIAVWQVVASVGLGLAGCLPCAAICALNSALLFARLSSWESPSPFFSSHRGLAAGGLGLLIGASAMAIATKPGIPTLNNGVRSVEQRLALEGKSLQSMGIRVAPSALPGVVVIGRHECEACSMADQALRNQKEVPYTFIELLADPGAVVQDAGREMKKPLNTMVAIPTVLLVDKSGVVQHQSVGWSGLGAFDVLIRQVLKDMRRS